MAVTSGFFNSVDGDRKYNAEEISNYFDGLISNGVYESIGNKLVVTAGDSMTVNVGTGRAMINCRWIKNDALLTLNIDPSDVQKNRIDAIVVRLDLSDSGRQISIVVKTGTPSATPQPPAITRTANVYELYLAYVKVNAKKTSITQSMIVDLRGTDLCGYVTGLIEQVDTSQLFAQYQAACDEYFETMTANFNAYIEAKQAAFDSWFSTLTEQLHVDTSLIKYQNTVVTTTETSEIKIGIAEYETGDILLVHIGGVLFVEGDEFTISGTGSDAKITLKNSVTANNPITFIVIKSVIGGDVVATKIDEINGEVV